jgi:hypothetical protein
LQTIGKLESVHIAQTVLRERKGRREGRRDGGKEDTP